MVQVVERAGWDDFGFILFQADYSSEERWERWVEGFNRIIDKSWAKVSGGNKLEDKLLTQLADFEEFRDAHLDQIAV